MAKSRHRKVGSNITSQKNKMSKVPHKKPLGECPGAGQAIGHREKVSGLPRKDQPGGLQGARARHKEVPENNPPGMGHTSANKALTMAVAVHGEETSSMHGPHQGSTAVLPITCVKQSHETSTCWGHRSVTTGAGQSSSYLCDP